MREKRAALTARFDAGPPRYKAQYDETGHDAGARSGAQPAATPHVFSVALVKSSCFYGYNPSEEPFLRITMCVIPDLVFLR